MIFNFDIVIYPEIGALNLALIDFHISAIRQTIKFNLIHNINQKQLSHFHIQIS